MKGFVFAGEKGNCIFPTTQVAFKKLMPKYGDTLIYYPVSILILAGICEDAIDAI